MTKKEKRMLEIMNVAKKVVVLEDIDLLKELAKH